jgi:hypothetical protein
MNLLWPNEGYSPSIFLEGLKNRKTLSQDGQSPG